MKRNQTYQHLMHISCKSFLFTIYWAYNLVFNQNKLLWNMQEWVSDF